MSQSDRLQMVIFVVGGEHYALPIEHVQEIITYTQPRPLDGDSAVRGVISLRGQIIPVFDLGPSLGLTGCGAGGEIIVVERPAGLAGVIVEGVNEVHTVERADLQEVPAGLGGGLGAIVHIGDRLVAVIDVSRIATETAGGFAADDTTLHAAA
jgi:purine-binding chemotaxis protein CheW